jgi:hypothetical protein
MDILKEKTEHTGENKTFFLSHVRSLWPVSTKEFHMPGLTHVQT